MFCAHCGSRVATSAFYCTSCGTSLIDKAVPAAIPPPPPPPVEQPPSGFATTALGLAAIGFFLSFLVVGSVFALPALILGVIALRRNPAFRMQAYTAIGIAAASLAFSGWMGYVFYQAFEQNGGDFAEIFEEHDDSSPFDEWEGRQAPDFSVTALDGSKITLSELRGKRVVLDFWATWCGPCLEQIPHYQELAKTAQDLVIVGISQEDEQTLRDFVAEHEVPYAVASAEDLPAPFSEVTGYPTAFFINREGVIETAKVGYAGLEKLRALALGSADEEAPEEVEQVDFVTVYVPETGGRTSLILAAEYGDLDAVEYFLEHGEEVGKLDDSGHSALTHAAMEGWEDIVETLIEAGAAVDLADNEGWTPLMHAARRGRTSAALVLLDLGADASKKRPDGRDALDDARESGRPELIEALLKP